MFDTLAELFTNSNMGHGLVVYDATAHINKTAY